VRESDPHLQAYLSAFRRALRQADKTGRTPRVEDLLVNDVVLYQLLLKSADKQIEQLEQEVRRLKKQEENQP
jgi:hypothetical protein